jgi:superfamily I DNA/RNA helicase
VHHGRLGAVQIAPREFIVSELRRIAAATPDHKFTLAFLLAEWDHVVDAWSVTSLDAYRDAPRLGRKSRLSERQRGLLWSIFGPLRERIREAGYVTASDLFAALARDVQAKGTPPCEHVVVDESQDLTPAQMQFLAALGKDRLDALFFAGDLGQRIFQQPFSWKSLGVDIRGRSRTLRINYRTSHQIRRQADLLLGPTVSDLDGNAEDRGDTISVFNGPVPEVLRVQDEATEIDAVANWLTARIAEGLPPHEIGLFVRSDAELDRARAALKTANLVANELDDQLESRPGMVACSTMHRAKGLEFRAVAVMACDDEVIPLQERIATVGDEADLTDVYDTERQLLYVACTRARDRLLLSAVQPGSEFLDDFEARNQGGQK